MKYDLRDLQRLKEGRERESVYKTLDENLKKTPMKIRADILYRSKYFRKLKVEKTNKEEKMSWENFPALLQHG